MYFQHFITLLIWLMFSYKKRNQFAVIEKKKTESIYLSITLDVFDNLIKLLGYCYTIICPIHNPH